MDECELGEYSGWLLDELVLNGKELEYVTSSPSRPSTSSGRISSEPKSPTASNLAVTKSPILLSNQFPKQLDLDSCGPSKNNCFVSETAILIENQQTDKTLENQDRNSPIQIGPNQKQDEIIPNELHKTKPVVWIPHQRMELLHLRAKPKWSLKLQEIQEEIFNFRTTLDISSQTYQDYKDIFILRPTNVQKIPNDGSTVFNTKLILKRLKSKLDKTSQEWDADRKIDRLVEISSSIRAVIRLTKLLNQRLPRGTLQSLNQLLNLTKSVVECGQTLLTVLLSAADDLELVGNFGDGASWPSAFNDAIFALQSFAHSVLLPLAQMTAIWNEKEKRIIEARINRFQTNEDGGGRGRLRLKADELLGRVTVSRSANHNNQLSSDDFNGSRSRKGFLIGSQLQHEKILVGKKRKEKKMHSKQQKGERSSDDREREVDGTTVESTRQQQSDDNNNNNHHHQTIENHGKSIPSSETINNDNDPEFVNGEVQNDIQQILEDLSLSRLIDSALSDVWAKIDTVCDDLVDGMALEDTSIDSEFADRQ